MNWSGSGGLLLRESESAEGGSGLAGMAQALEGMSSRLDQVLEAVEGSGSDKAEKK